MKQSSPIPTVGQLENKPGCVQAALGILGDKWSPLLLGNLIDSPKTFGELTSALPGISPRTLSARLVCLEDAEIIHRLEYCSRPPRYKYCLTKKGEDLRVILVKMADWGQKYS